MNDDKIPETVKMKRLITNYLEVGNSYEFIFRSNDENNSIRYIFENDEIINVIRLDIDNRKSINKFDCR